jgi:phospholipid transport system substrate-binding protein
LVTKIAGHLGEYEGVRVSIGLARGAEDTEIVITTIDRPNNPTYQVDWVVSISTGGPRIVDLLGGGTSLRLTQSSDFAAYLARHQYSIHERIEGMHPLIAQRDRYAAVIARGGIFPVAVGPRGASLGVRP